VIAAALMRISMHCVCNLMSASSPPFLLFIETVCLSDVWPGNYFYRGLTGVTLFKIDNEYKYDQRKIMILYTNYNNERICIYLVLCCVEFPSIPFSSWRRSYL
jgi:hypothetical protein